MSEILISKSILLVLEIRRFQHLAQVQLGMHKEHLYEFMHFIRGSPDILRGLQQTAKQLTSEKTSGKMIILVNYLTDIKVKQKFVSVNFLLNQILVSSFFR